MVQATRQLRRRVRSYADCKGFNVSITFPAILRSISYPRSEFRDLQQPQAHSNHLQGRPWPDMTRFWPHNPCLGESLYSLRGSCRTTKAWWEVKPTRALRRRKANNFLVVRQRRRRLILGSVHIDTWRQHALDAPVLLLLPHDTKCPPRLLT